MKYKIKKRINFSAMLPDGTEITASSRLELQRKYKKFTSVKNQKNIRIDFPIILKAVDYHIFQDYQSVFETLLKDKISYQEFEANEEDPDGNYTAIFWLGIGKPTELINKMIKDYTETFEIKP